MKKGKKTAKTKKQELTKKDVAGFYRKLDLDEKTISNFNAYRRTYEENPYQYTGFTTNNVTSI